MIPSIYNEDAMGSLTELPTELLEFCRREKMTNYNITPMAGIIFYISLVENAKSVLEIGTGWCLSTIALASAMKITGGKVLSFDMHDRNNILASVPELRPIITQINISSHNTTVTIPLIQKQFEEIDILFIDGDHTKEGVKSDFENYTPLLSKNGIIILHDIALYQPGKDYTDTVEICKYWPEIDTTKFDKFPLYASNGLGLLRKK